MDVHCAACGASNVDGARFCSTCGARLAASCPVCGAPVTAGQRFCDQCGSALAPAAVAPAPEPTVERRVCSILFFDLVGFTPISEARDPEAVRELLDQYFDTARTVIGRYGGTIEKFIGDAVMAVWGTPTATEDDAERAVRAALELVDAIAALGRTTGVAGLAARAGIVTAEVAVDPSATGQGMVAGDPVNTAARVQAAAEPDQVLVDDGTARVIRAAIDVEDTGVHALKGKSAPQRLWHAVRVLANVGGVQRVDGLEAPLIGRDVELRIVKDLFHATVDRRTSQLVTVIGDVGSGKSRLGWEFEKYVDGLAGAVLWHRGRCRSYGDGVAFWALSEMVRQRLGIADEDAPEVALTLLLEGVDEFVPDPDERAFVGLRLARLLGLSHPVDDGRDLERNDLFAGWRTWLVRLTDSAPVVWVIEDLQFADSGLLDFVDHLLDWARASPIHLLGLARPDIDDRRAGWTSGRRRQQIALDPLDDPSMRQLIDALVPGMPDRAAQLIAAQAQGVPLFAVETVRSLIDRDVVVPKEGRYRLVGEVTTLAVPDGLRSVFAARLDLLDAPIRDLLATAAVLGTTFPADALSSVSGESIGTVRAALDRLVARDLLTVSADPLSPQRGSYGFTHDLLRRVAVETLSRKEQRTRHLLVAEHLRTVFPDDGEEVAEVIAQHLLDAVDAAPEAEDVGRLTERAIDELVRAGDRSARLGAPVRAAEAWQRASGYGSDRHRAAQLLERAADTLIDDGAEESGQVLAELARDTFEGLGDRRAAAAADAVVGRAMASAGRIAQALEHLERAVERLRGTADLALLHAVLQLATAATFASAPNARSLVDEAISLGERLDVSAPELSRLFSAVALVHTFKNERHRAVAAFRESTRLAVGSGQWRAASVGLGNLASLQTPYDPSDAVDAATQALAYARRAGSRRDLAFGVENLSHALICLGRWSEAAAAIESGREVDGVEDMLVFHESVARLAGLRGDRAVLLSGRASMAAFADEDPQSTSAIAYLDLLALGPDADPAEALEMAMKVFTYRSDLGVNFVYVRDSWSVAARAATRLSRDHADDVLALLDGYLPTELSPAFRAERQLALARVADDPEAAFAAAIDAQRGSSPPHLLAHGLLDWAEHRIAASRPGDAVPLIEEAVGIAERLGGAPIVQRADLVRASVPIAARIS